MSVRAPELSPLTQITGTVVGSLATAGATALAARIFTYINPLSAAVYGATFALSGSLIVWGCAKAEIPLNSAAAKVSIFIAQIALGALATHAVGVPLTVQAAIGLPFVTGFMIVGGAICTIGAVSAVLIARVMIRDRCGIAQAVQTLIREGAEGIRDAAQNASQRSGVDAQPLVELLNNFISELPDAVEVDEAPISSGA